MSGDEDTPLAAERKLLADAKETQLVCRRISLAEAHAGSCRISRRSWARWLTASPKSTRWNRACLRAEKLLARGPNQTAAKTAVAMTRFYAERAIRIVETSATNVIAAVADGDMLRTQMAILRRLAKHEPANTVALGREIARGILNAGRYSLQ